MHKIIKKKSKNSPSQEWLEKLMYVKDNIPHNII